MTFRTILLLFFVLFSSFSFFSLTNAVYQEPEMSGVNYRRKSVNNHMKTTLQTANGQLYRLDWTKKAECYVEDSANDCRLVENGTTCFGATIPFMHSSWKHLETLKWGSNTGELVEQLGIYSGLPECWKLLRELLCAVFYPPCKNGRVLRIPKTLCVEARSKCSFLVERNLWPNAFGDCYFSNETSWDGLNSLFTRDCKISRNIIWPSNSGKCFDPLTATDFKPGWLVDRCGLNCTSLRIDRSQPIQQLLMISLVVVFVGSFFTAIFLRSEDQEIKTRRPYFWPLFYFLLCHLVISMCWLVQITSDARTICRDDGSIRLQEPTRAGILCVLQYITLLGCSVGSATWIISFAYMHLQWRRKPDTCVFSQYQHVPVVALAIIMITGGLVSTQVDGDPVLSVCFVSRATWHGVMWYVAPLAISSLAVLLLFLGIFMPPAKGDCAIDERPMQPPSIVQVGILLLFLIVLHSASAILLFVDMRHSDTLRRVIMNYVDCKLRSGHHDDEDDPSGACPYPSDGDVRLAQLQIVFMCAPALVVVVWLILCAGYGKRWMDLLKRAISICKKKSAPAKNGDIVMTEMKTLSDQDAEGTIAANRRLRYQNYRRSSDYSSTSSIGGAVSEPEYRQTTKESQRQFISRWKMRNKHRNIPRSNSSLAMVSVGTASSFGSVPLATGSSHASLPFADLRNYPVLPSANTNSWWPPFGWPYPPWPWMYCYQPPPGTGASAGPVDSTMAPVTAVTTASSEQQRLQATATANGTTSAAQDNAQVPPAATKSNVPSPETMTSMMAAAGNAPFYWPYPFPPYPQYWPPTTGQMCTPPENQVIATTSKPSSPAQASPSTAPKILEVSEKAANGDDANGGDVEQARMNEEDSNEVEPGDDEENFDSEEEVGTDEEELIEEQVRLLLRTDGSCT